MPDTEESMLIEVFSYFFRCYNFFLPNVFKQFRISML